MFDFMRHVVPDHAKNLPKELDPFLVAMFEKLGRRPGPRDPTAHLHPAFLHKILKSPLPGARKVTQSENSLHHTVVLGDKHKLDVSKVPDIKSLGTWWRGKSLPTSMKLYLHVLRESFTLEITVAVSLLILSEIYSTHTSRVSANESGQRTNDWEPRPCYRLEYGHSPVSDFGICKGRVQGKTNRVQTWTYYEPKSNTRTSILDPDNHYWLYFRTIKGEEITLDCCSYSLGMETCVDASGCIKRLPETFRNYGSARTPANFRTPQDHDRQTYTLIEEQRFSVMHNTRLHHALSWEVFGGQKEEQHEIVREFITQLQGKPCTMEQEGAVRDYRSSGALILNQVLTGRQWTEWGKPVVYSRDDCFDEGNGKKDEFLRGSPEDKECIPSYHGLLGMFSEAIGFN